MQNLLYIELSVSDTLMELVKFVQTAYLLYYRLLNFLFWNF